MQKLDIEAFGRSMRLANIDTNRFISKDRLVRDEICEISLRISSWIIRGYSKEQE